MFKAVKYRIYPNEEQKEKLESYFNGARWVYNNYLAAKNKNYEDRIAGLNPEKISSYSFITDLTNRKYEDPELKSWLPSVNAQVIQQSVLHVDNAFKNFFQNTADKPVFKKKHIAKKSISFPNGGRIGKSSVTIPGIKKTKAAIHRTIEGVAKSMTVSCDRSGRYFASILYETNEQPKALQKVTEQSEVLGLDLGIKTLAADSSGGKHKIDPEYRKSENKLKRLHRAVSRKEKGSNNRAKAKTKLSKCYAYVSDKRKDQQHKLSKELVSTPFKAFSIEDLNISGMLKNDKLARHIQNSSWYQFISFLTYKSEWEGKQVVKIGRFDPTSKTCSSCGYIKSDLTLGTRAWTCPNCNAIHDRDINAAINIQKSAWNILSSKAEEPTAGTAERSTKLSSGKRLGRTRHSSKNQEASDFSRG